LVLAGTTARAHRWSKGVKRLTWSHGSQRALSRLVIFGKLRVRADYGFKLVRDAREILPAHDDIHFAVSKIGVNAVPNAAIADDRTLYDGGGQSHASRPAEHREMTRAASALSGLLQDHNFRCRPNKQREIRIDWRIAEWRVDDHGRSASQARNRRNLVHPDVT